MAEKSLKDKINQILYENKAIIGASEGYDPISGNPDNSEPLTPEQLKALGIIVSKESVELNPKIYNTSSEYIIGHLNEVHNVNQLEDMIYKHCRKMGEVHDDKGNLTGNLVPEQTYKEGKYRRIAQEIFPLIKKDY